MTKSAAKSKAGYIAYIPGEPLRKVAHRSVSTSKTVLPLKRCRAVARKSIPPRKLSLKKKPTARWSSNYCLSLSVSDCNNQSYDSESDSSPMSCCSSEASNVLTSATWSSSYSVSLSDEDYGNYHCADHSDSSDNSSSGSSSSSTLFSSGSSSSDSSPVYEQPTVYVLCKLVNGVLVRV